MTKRHAWWVIVMGDQATAFRARDREELLPTLKQLQHTQPDAALKWFERGRLWTSPDEAREAAKAARRPQGPPRTRDWRPGGTHADPRAKYKLTRDQKRARWKQRQPWQRDDDGRGGSPGTRGSRDERAPKDRGGPPLEWKPPRPKDQRPAYGTPGGKGGARPPGPHGGKPGRPWSGHGKPGPKGSGGWAGRGKPGPKGPGAWAGHGKPGPKNRGGWKPRPQGMGGRGGKPPGAPPRLEWKPPRRKRRDDDES
jgi:hypothetical protein